MTKRTLSALRGSAVTLQRITTDSESRVDVLVRSNAFRTRFPLLVMVTVVVPSEFLVDFAEYLVVSLTNESNSIPAGK